MNKTQKDAIEQHIAALAALGAPVDLIGQYIVGVGGDGEPIVRLGVVRGPSDALTALEWFEKGIRAGREK